LLLKNKGSYHEGHKPILHHQFIELIYHRKRYWGRSTVGWKHFDAALPNIGHFALADLEAMGLLAVTMEDRADFYEQVEEEEEEQQQQHDQGLSTKQRKLSIVTQNVDSLHHRAGSKEILSLHGRNEVVKCVSCGHQIHRNDY
jgi:NAD-dependent deacetylase sirtuin 4